MPLAMSSLIPVITNQMIDPTIWKVASVRCQRIQIQTASTAVCCTSGIFDRVGGHISDHLTH